MAFTIARPATFSGEEGDIPTRVTIAWLTDASGDYTESVDLPCGWIMRLVTVPNAAASPTADYDITLIEPLDALSVLDVLEGAGADRHTTAAEVVQPVGSGAATPVYVFAGVYTFTVANGGNAKQGTCYLDMVVHG